jgi:MFS family permease
VAAIRGDRTGGLVAFRAIVSAPSSCRFENSLALAGELAEHAGPQGKTAEPAIIRGGEQMAVMASDQGDSGQPNHPLATRMAVIAFLNQNITIGCLWGSFSVLLTSVEAHLSVGRELSTLAAPAVNLATAVFAPLTGVLAARLPIRLIMLVGAILSVAGYMLLALTASFPLYILAYGLLLGPAMAAIGVILPATLVTRWFSSNRGRTLGIVSTPIVVALVPLAATWMLQAHGLAAAYMMLAAISAICIVANLFVLDQPPGSHANAETSTAAHGPTAAGEGGISVAALLRMPRFWAIVIAAAASFCSSIILTSHMVPMAAAWGISASLAATLLTAQSLAGIAGGLFFGWIADRIGGMLTLAILLLDTAILWALLLLQPPFAAAIIIIALVGVHGAGVLPVFGVTLSEAFGRENFSRAYGIANLINLPFSVICVPAAAMVYARTGSYTGAIIGEGLFLLLGAILVFLARKSRAAAQAAT